LSFPEEKRVYVNKVANRLCELTDTESVFYDNYYKAELARPNIDLLLQKIYHENSEVLQQNLWAADLANAARAAAGFMK
jgi:hypothetical protein